ncbi:MAG: hypothetical protein KDB27_02875 [Planctomycetales bacterium]|nr:hypothetical protein [Planctomycetales bacterium]
MSVRHAQRGRITKIVRVPRIGECPFDTGCPSPEGYGIIRSTNGKDVYFVDAVVCEETFAQLYVGDEVWFTFEMGPLSPAASVWKVAAEAQPDLECRPLATPQI